MKKGFKFALANNAGVVAQLVEQRTENPCVTGSIPVDATSKARFYLNRAFLFSIFQHFSFLFVDRFFNFEVIQFLKSEVFMKKLIGLLLVLTSFFFAISCNNESEHDHSHEHDIAVDLAQEKLEISQLLDNLVVATESGDFEMIAKIWLPSEDALLIGTDSGEKLDGA